MLQYVPESTRYLVAAGRTTEARKILKRGAEMNHSTLPTGSLVESSVKVPLLLIHSFYIALLSALEQAHFTRAILNE